jgi:glucose-1-phosphate thymidylyltransferase
VKPSARGELEITSLIEFYLKKKELTYTALGRGTAWLDTGNPNSLHDASSYVRVIEERSGLKIGCLEEIAFQNGWLTKDDLLNRAKQLGNNSYAKYLIQIIR